MDRDHLVLYEKVLLPSAEWNVRLPGWVFLCARSGDGCLLSPGRPRLINEGDVLMKNQSARMQLRASRLGELRLQLFQIRSELLAGIVSPVERERLQFAAQGNGLLCHFPAASPLALQFTDLSSFAAVGDSLLVRCRMLNLAATVLVSQLPPEERVRVRGWTARERFQQLMKRIPEAQLQYHSAHELAVLCRCSVRHFRRLFRERFGDSLLPKKTELRLRRAQELLQHTDAKIIEVALESGFQHLGLFASAFKQRFGVTPSEWRRRKASATPRVKVG
jgi:AraC-like DNA-binding protein